MSKINPLWVLMIGALIAPAGSASAAMLSFQGGTTHQTWANDYATGILHPGSSTRFRGEILFHQVLPLSAECSGSRSGSACGGQGELPGARLFMARFHQPAPWSEIRPIEMQGASVTFGYDQLTGEGTLRFAFDNPDPIDDADPLTFNLMLFGGVSHSLLEDMGNQVGWSAVPGAAQVDAFAHFEIDAVYAARFDMAFADGRRVYGNLGQMTLTETPLPAGIGLLAAGLIGLGVLRRRRGLTRY
jgi:hypothetical protein